MVSKLFKKAAVKFKPMPMSEYVRIEGATHIECHEKIKSKYMMNTLKFPDVFQVEEGYILHNGVYVDRFGAMSLAVAAGIIKEDYKDDKLFFDYKVDWSKVNEN